MRGDAASAQRVLLCAEANWSSGFKPATCQGTVLRASGQAALGLESSSNYPADLQRDLTATGHERNASHPAARPGCAELLAHIAVCEHLPSGSKERRSQGHMIPGGAPQWNALQ